MFTPGAPHLGKAAGRTARLWGKQDERGTHEIVETISAVRGGERRRADRGRAGRGQRFGGDSRARFGGDEDDDAHQARHRDRRREPHVRQRLCDVQAAPRPDGQEPPVGGDREGQRRPGTQRRPGSPVDGDRHHGGRVLDRPQAGGSVQDAPRPEHDLRRPAVRRRTGDERERLPVPRQPAECAVPDHEVRAVRRGARGLPGVRQRRLRREIPCTGSTR